MPYVLEGRDFDIYCDCYLIFSLASYFMFLVCHPVSMLLLSCHLFSNFSIFLRKL